MKCNFIPTRKTKIKLTEIPTISTDVGLLELLCTTGKNPFVQSAYYYP